MWVPAAKEQRRSPNPQAQTIARGESLPVERVAPCDGGVAATNRFTPRRAFYGKK